MNDSLFFIHIPKTAGTSLRFALEEAFASKILKDYGHSTQTSEVFNHLDRNGYEFESYLAKNDIKVFTGHVRLTEKRFSFRSRNIFCFLRNPLDQVISHYNHHKFHYSYDKTLEEFISDKRFQNIQSKFLSGLPIRQLGFVGLTEAFDTSVAIINKLYNLDLKCLQKNESLINKPQATNEIIDLIKVNNKSDFELYDTAKTMFEQRKRLFEQSLPWTYGESSIERFKLKGWAYTDTHTAPVTLGIYLNDELIGQVDADKLLPNLRAFGVPRNGYVGYNLKLPNIKPNTQVSIVNLLTTQVVNRHML